MNLYQFYSWFASLSALQLLRMFAKSKDVSRSADSHCRVDRRPKNDRSLRHVNISAWAIAVTHVSQRRNSVSRIVMNLDGPLCEQKR